LRTHCALREGVEGEAEKTKVEMRKEGTNWMKRKQKRGLKGAKKELR